MAPPRRSFGPDESALDDSPDGPEPTTSRIQRFVGRMSFGSVSRHRGSFVSRWRNQNDNADGEGDNAVDTPGTERPPIPVVMQAAEPYATPLPILSMIVLSITMLGEFLSANVSTPFVLFMVKGFRDWKDDAEIAFWTGILVSTFFLTQFLTAILWATVAEKHGRRFVLVVSLLGSALTCAAFGTSTSLEEAICIRLLQGVFAGAVGVARGSVAFITDASNEGRAYAILGFCWGLGGVAGAIVGGAFERPAVKWSGVFENTLFDRYPYLLACGVASSVTLLGSILGCFLGPDGGPREGAIRLIEKSDQHPTIPEEEESRPPTPVFDDEERQSTLGRRMSKKLSSYFARQATERDPLLTPGAESSQPAVRLDRTRTFSSSRPSRANGSAYGYAGSYRSRLASSVVNNRRGSNASTMRRRHMSLADSQQRDSMASSTDLNFAQRLLIANENAVTNIADLWVAAAMNVDNEDVFEDSDTELGENDEEEETEDRPSRSVLVSPIGGRPSTSRRLSAGRRPSSGPVGRFESPRRPSTVRRPSFSQTLDGARRPSVVPSIFAHPGVKTPPAVLDAQMLLSRDPDPPSAGPDLLEPIIESRRVSLHDAEGQIEVIEPQPSMMSQLPVLVIIQYGMLALHTTTHDQIFLSYLVSDVNAGGLNLEASHFAQLIALMCLAQIAYQFYLYPNIGPPRGRFSHLAMFRIGSVLFIPAYLAVILLHPFATDSEGENFSVMSGLAVITAVRYSGGTFCYTSISILLNYMTPPPAIGLANGMAQSIVSLARCFGPVLGGYLWSVSVQDNPSGYPLGFVICGAACLFSVLHSFMIR